MRGLFRILFTTVLAIASAGSIPMSANAQIAEATTTIEGLTCPFCSFGAKKRLKTVDGVGKVTVDVGKGIAALQAEPGQSIDVQQIPEAVKKAGFAPGTVRIVAIGRVQNDNGRLLLHLSGQEERFLLEETDTVQRATLLSFMDKGVEIEVTGRWSLSETEPDARITPESVSKR